MTEELQMTEADSLREIAKNMNLKVGNLQDVDKLKALIESNRVVPQNTAAAKESRKQALRKEAFKLHRIKLTATSPFEKQMPSTTISAGNSLIGDVQRTIQFDEPWHVEEIILNALREKKYRTKKDYVDPVTRRKTSKNVYYNAYNIEILPALTTEELKELAATQLATGATKD